jgi:hypothetical protein
VSAAAASEAATGGIDDAAGDPSVVGDVAVESDAGDDTDSGAAGSDDEGVAVGNESFGGGGDAAAAAACAVLVTAEYLGAATVAEADCVACVLSGDALGVTGTLARFFLPLPLMRVCEEGAVAKGVCGRVLGRNCEGGKSRLSRAHRRSRQSELRGAN